MSYTDRAVDIVERWAKQFPESRYVDVDGSAENALLAVTPGEVVDLVADVLRKENALGPRDRVEHLTGRVGTVLTLPADEMVSVHWDGFGPDTAVGVPVAHLRRLRA